MKSSLRTVRRPHQNITAHRTIITKPTGLVEAEPVEKINSREAVNSNYTLRSA